MTRIALLLEDGVERASLSAMVGAAFGDKVNIVDDVSCAEGQLVVAVVPSNRVVPSLELGCADFVTTPCDANEVLRVLASVSDADACEESLALLGEVGRTTLTELRSHQSRIVLRGEKGTGVVSFARYWASLDGSKVRVVEAESLDVALADSALVVVGIESLAGQAQEQAWAQAAELSRTTRVAVAVIGAVPQVDDWPVVLVPTMRDRIVDVVRLVHAFERLFAIRRGHDVVVPMRSLSAMQSYRWPNQLPELRATVDSLCLGDVAPSSRGVSAEYRVPVQSEDVMLHLLGGVTKFGSLFWPSEVEFADSLETGDAFFPVNVDGKIQIVARAAVEAFGIPQARESVAWEPEVLAKRVRAKLHMQSGATYEGEFVYSAAQSRARVADHLNAKARYFLFRIGTELLHVSKAHLVWVEELR